MQLLIIRHLATAWNQEGRLQGKQDIPILPPDGSVLTDIDDNRERILAIGPLDGVVTSALIRTEQTADLYDLGAYQREPLLNELDFGPFEGVGREEFRRTVGSVWRDDPRQLVLGESIAAFSQRVETFLTNYRHHQRLLCFGHGAWIRCLLSILEHGDARAMNRLRVDNNVLYELTV